MKKLIACLICMLMLCSALAETGGLRLENAYVDYEGETYMLNPAAEVGWMQQEDSVLFGFGIECEGETLLPMQFKVDASGLSMLVGGSSTVYRLSPALIEEFYGPTSGDEAEMAAMMASLIEAADAMVNAPMTQEAVDGYLSVYHELGQFGEGEEALVELDGETFSATKYTCALDFEGYLASMAAERALLGDALMDAAERMLLITDGYAEAADLDAAYREIYKDITGTVEEYHVESTGAIVMDFTEHYVYADGTEESGDSRIIVYDAQHIVTIGEGIRMEFEPGTARLEFIDEDSYEPTAMTASLERNAEGRANAELEICYENTVLDENVKVSFAGGLGLDGLQRFEVAADCAFVFSSDTADDMHFELCVTENADGTFGGTTAMSYADNTNDTEAGFGCTFEMHETVVTDRMEDRRVVEFEDYEDLENSSSLMLAFMGLMGDVEKLINEDSVAAMIEGVTSTEEQSEEDLYGEFEPWPAPRFNAELEDYITVSASSTGYEDFCAGTYVLQGDDGMICISYTGSSALQDYMSAKAAADGKEDAEKEPDAAQDVPDVSIDMKDGFARAIISHQGYTVVVECYDAAASWEVLSPLIAGIEFPEQEQSDEETAPAVKVPEKSHNL